MPSYEFVTVDVFTDRRFGGNPLAVFPDAQGISDADMQALASEFNLSEITFVLPPSDPAHTARVRIFGPTHELPFAGHPNVGTALVLAARAGAPPEAMVFEELAGLVRVCLAREGGQLTATVDAPQPLRLGADVPPPLVAACAGLSLGDIVTDAHGPCVASVGLGFALAEVSAAALAGAAPDVAAFREAAAATPTMPGTFSLHLYARDGDRLRARMFAPLAGIPEDPATGSANAALAALLLHLAPGRDRVAFEVAQGAEMGRPSLLRACAWREGSEVRAGVGGGAVPVLRGSVDL